MLTSVAVGTTPVIFNPAAFSSIPYSAAVRSSPPEIASTTHLDDLNVRRTVGDWDTSYFRLDGTTTSSTVVNGEKCI